MYHIPCQGSTGTFRSNLYRTADRGHAHPDRICYRSLAGDQTATQLERLLQMAPGRQVVLGRPWYPDGPDGGDFLSPTGLVSDH